MYVVVRCLARGQCMRNQNMTPAGVWVVTGASRGIGVEFVRQILLLEHTTVIACARSPEHASDLQELKAQHKDRLQLVTLDVADTSSIHGAAEHVSKVLGVSSLDYLINNAAVSDPGQSRLQTAESLRQTLEVNVVGVHAMIQAFLPLLQAGHKKTVINISSGSGSLSRRYEEFANRHQKESKHLPTSLSYKTSKSAINMLTLSWASDVTPEEGFTFVAIHPGVVATDMNTASMRALNYDEAAYASRLTPAQAVQQLLETITSLTPKESGRYLNLDGKPIAF
ncbi:TPA: hypothetical protein ACH3X3_002202 [Trebouxia sp. C0006]